MIQFFNIRTKEVRNADDEMKVAALWSSSDRGPNAHTGQDFGWRLAPQVVVELRDIMSNPQRLLNIASTYGIMLENVNEATILQYISDQTDAENAPVASDADYSTEYDNEIRRIEAYRIAKTEEARIAKAEAAAQRNAEIAALTTTTTTESLADMEKRAELAERIAAANAAATTTTTEPIKTATTTTTKKA